jgi:hypothetical protein
MRVSIQWRVLSKAATGDDEESARMRRFFEVGNAASIRTLQKHFERPR